MDIGILAHMYYSYMQVEARSDKTGEIVYKDTLDSAVAGIVKVWMLNCVQPCVALWLACLSFRLTTRWMAQKS